MASIFISYRRADSSVITGRIYDRLRQEFGKENIFKDVDNIGAGVDFRGVLREATSQCHVMLVVIGPNWIHATDAQGKRRLDDPDDFVRTEVEAGLQRNGILVIPLLVSNASPPKAGDLPDSLKALAFNNARLIRDDPDFHHDMNRLIAEIKPHLEITRQPLYRVNWGWLIAAIVIPLIAALITIVPPMLERIDASATQAALSMLATQAQSAQTQTQQYRENETAAAALTQQYRENETATAASWTATPLPTFDPTRLVLSSDAKNSDWTPVVANFDDVTMVLVPVGCFEMGIGESASKQCFDTPFWIDQYEVTNEQFERFNGVAASRGHWIDAKRPRETINWDEARDFCILRDARLPNAREWQYAARGPSGWLYTWGSDWNPDNLVWGQSSNRHPADVGSRPNGQSWVGAFDMNGNVWEWLSTMFGTDINEDYDFADEGETLFPPSYATGDGREQQYVDLDNDYVARGLMGGSWSETEDRFQLYSGVWNPESAATNIYGFRCVRDFE